MLKRLTAFIYFSLFAISSLSAAESKDDEAKKYYCSAEQLKLGDSRILVNFEGETIEIDALLADQGGIYFTSEAKRCFYCRRPLNPKNTCECPL
ncbi:MAG: hypothetical protein WAM28_07215 [Chlamydiales bacterium]